ncbi:Ger(x)C family spore germination protein [Metabacillus bambusae]|uniref:Ger(X)C family spore germination protein n=1 Tax=Metabacillus bambusae TaxID=2795218 RepID=A0ABS3N3Y6_9BACI|nr:Ger(x)C family spore germination protein [Metabacillus bambusae]MBO1513016.1 Ger(x)C family spore germination protein [Metabacillus bambusae]
MNKKMIGFFVLMSFLLTGCWDKEELNDVSIVTGIAVDPGEEKKYKMTVEIVNSPEYGKQGALGNTPVITYSLEGNSLSELSNKMNVGLDRKLIYSHTRVLFINEEIAREGLFGFLDFLERSGHFRNDFNILITKGNPASDFTKITYPIQKSPSLKLHKQIQTFLEEWGGDPRVRLTDFISSIISKGKNPVAATVVLKGDVEKGKNVENNKSLEPEALILIDGIAIFKDDKMLGSIPLKETRAYLWTQKLKHTSLSIPCEEGKEEKELYFDVRVSRSNTKLKVSYKNNNPKLIVKITGETKIQGSECTNDLTKIDVFMEYEKKINEFVKKDITSTIQSIQEEYGVDIFGFGEALYRQDPQKFKKEESKWDEVFAEAEVDVEVDLHLLRSGIKNKSFMTDLKTNKE